MTFAIRHGLPHERAALEDLQRRASLAYDDYRPYLLANPDAIALPLSQLAEQRVRVAEIAGRVAGFSVLLPREDLFELDGLFIEPDCWRRGIGRALVQDAAVTARRAGAGIIAVVANPRAEGFYASIGFAVTGVAQTQFGPAHRMRLQLR